MSIRLEKNATTLYRVGLRGRRARQNLTVGPSGSCLVVGVRCRFPSGSCGRERCAASALDQHKFTDLPHFFSQDYYEAAIVRQCRQQPFQVLEMYSQYSTFGRR